MSDNQDQGNGKDLSKLSPQVRPPEKIARKTTSEGVEQSTRDFPVLVVLGILAGVYIAFGGLFATVAQAGAEGMLAPGVTQVLAGVTFSLGLILVLIGGAELFTGNTLMVVAVAADRAEVRNVLWALALAFVTNFVGSIVIVVLAFLGEVHLVADGGVGAAALDTARSKATLGFGTVIASGILANMLVCLAVWLAFGARSAADKVLVIIFPIAAFVAADLEHSVANMSLIPFGLIIKQFASPEFWAEAGLNAAAYADLTWGGFARNLTAATIGNIIGGALIGGAYWFSYLRHGDEEDEDDEAEE
jgi:formate transporter